MPSILIRAALACALAWGVGAQAQTSAACPPQAQPPTPEQIQAAQRDAQVTAAPCGASREDGSTHHLFGTIHVGKLEWAMPGPQLRAALAPRDTIALEIDPTDPQMLSRMSAAGAQGAPRRTRRSAGRANARRLDAACLPAQLGRPAQHPVMRALTLSLLEARGRGWRWLRDGVRAGRSRPRHRAPHRVAGIARVAVGGADPKEPAEVDRMIVATLDQLDEGTAATVARLAAAWARGDMAGDGAVRALVRLCDDRRRPQLMVRLIDERNPALADRIEALHGEGQRLFAAVGALHMAGPQALPALLEARGFTVERVTFH